MITAIEKLLHGVPKLTSTNVINVSEYFCVVEGSDLENSARNLGRDNPISPLCIYAVVSRWCEYRRCFDWFNLVPVRALYFRHQRL